MTKSKPYRSPLRTFVQVLTTLHVSQADIEEMLGVTPRELKAMTEGRRPVSPDVEAGMFSSCAQAVRQLRKRERTSELYYEAWVDMRVEFLCKVLTGELEQ